VPAFTVTVCGPKLVGEINANEGTSPIVGRARPRRRLLPSDK
jgi:hypothetical protein